MNRESLSASRSGPKDRVNPSDIAGNRAPGAIPPTGGVPPEDASGLSGNAFSRSATDDLVDGFELMMRAMRKLADKPDPQLESIVERVVRELQQIEEDAGANVRADNSPELERLCAEAAHELKRVVEAVAVRIESAFSGRAPVGV